MRGFVRMAIVLGAVVGLLAAGGPASALTPTELKCEYKTNPLGIDVAKPRLTWILESEARGQHQSAYRILVSSSEALLKADNGDLWDSGRVTSSNSVLIPYGGKALASRQQCFWKVQVWDGAGKAAGWSPVAFWSMGFLSPGDWSAQWIGYDADPPSEENEEEAFPKIDLDGANWIWFPEGQPERSAPCEERFFRRTLDLPADKTIADAQLLVAVDNRAEMFINGESLGSGGRVFTSFTQARRENVKENLKPGKNVLALKARNDGDNPNPASLLLKLGITLSDGTKVVVVSDGSWKAAKGEMPEAWQNADFDDSAWVAAKVTAGLGGGPWGSTKTQEQRGVHVPPPPYLRKEFAAKGGVKRATVYASAMGLYALEINGKRVGVDHFTPGWTDFLKRVYYNTYDVTALVNAGGPNAIGAILADGWYAGYVGGGLTRERYGDKPRLRVQLELEYADGSTQRIVTDDSWKAAYGAILEADLQMGEWHDNRISMEGWSSPGYDASAWKAPEIGGLRTEMLVQAYPGVPVRHFETLPAQTVREHKPGVFIYDMKQNMVGWIRLNVQGKKGDTVRIRYAEMLDEDGGIYTTNLRGARATDHVTLKGDGVEVFEPEFTFHGFQYVEITGVDQAPALGDVEGIVLNSAIEQTGFIECSNELVNQLFHNIVWGQKGNYFEVPTDCPQRDERLGWTGDAQFFMNTAAYTADVGAFFTKWLVDLAQDSQLPDGSFAHVAPRINMPGGAVAWGDAAIICTYEIYRYYGDTRIIEAHYDNLVRSMDFLEKTSENHIRKNLGFGDWLNKGGGAKAEVICTAYYAYLAGLMAEMGEAVGRSDDAKRFAKLHDDVRAAFIENFVDDTGKILDSSQTGYALAFTMDLIPEELKAGASKHFVSEIERFDNHLATGFIGTPRLLPALSLAGRDDVAYQLLMTTTYPSWLFQVTLGATTMWERWDGWTPDQGFQDPAMNSFNHYAFGAVGEWMYGTMGGIQAAEPGFGTIVIAPKPGGGLDWAKVAYRSVRGRIASEWMVKNGKLDLRAVVPANTTATVYVPAEGLESVREGGKPAAQAEGVKQASYDGTCAVFVVGSGDYHFEQ